MLKKSPLYLSHILNISLEKNDILLQYSGEFIVYNGSWQYHLIIIDSIAETVSEYATTFYPLPHLSPNTISFIPSGANKQKIKRIDHRKCNVRASKNAEQAFSTQ